MREPVSVVIPTRDGAATLPALFEALERQKSERSQEWIVVDSGSRDGSAEIARHFGARVHTVAPAEFDHGATRNLGLSLTSAPYVAFLTQDATPAHPLWLESLLAPFEDPEVAGVFGRQIPRGDCEVLARRRLLAGIHGRLEPARSHLAAECFEDLPAAERMRRSTFDNVCSALRRTRWQEIPFARSRFAEDLEWGRDVLRAGWTIAYAPDAAVLHSHRRSQRYEYERTRLEHRRLRELFGVVTLPRRRDLLRAVLRNALRDLPVVAREAPRGVERCRQLARSAGLSLLSPLAQYQGARDAGEQRPPRSPRVPL